MRSLFRCLATIAGLFLLAAGRAPANPAISDDFIVFGYLQSTSVLPHVRWHALTHVGTTFIDFDANGNLMNLTSFTGRSSVLKSGGAAQGAGTKVVMVVRNDNFYDGSPAGEPDVINACMASAAARTNLVNQIWSAINADGYCAGVSLDFEFTWGTTTRNNITLFMQELHAAKPAGKEISIYTHATYSSTLWDIAAVEPYIDYMLYSTYDWATGSNTHTPSDYNNCIPHLNSYINAGLPPEKLVLVWGTYGRQWSNVTGYNTAGTGASSRGFPDGLFATTLNQTNGGPHTANYVTGDETAWHTFNDGTNHVMVWDSPESMEVKSRAALSFPGSAAPGRRLGGVGFWSLLWMNKNGNPNFPNELDSYDPITNAVVARMRTYPHWYQLCTELFAEPGQTKFVFEKFEGSDTHWSDPNKSPDTVGDTDNDSALAIVAAPAGAGRPTTTTKAGRVTFDFEASTGNRIFFRHEILNDDANITVADTHSAVVHVTRNTAFSCHYYTPAAYSGRTVRMALLDADREVEISPAISLNTTGWKTLTWDLTNPANVLAYDTSEPNLLDGDGVLDSIAGAKDIKFLGFIIEGGAAGSGQVFFDELSYEKATPGGDKYTINEFRYNNSAQEFVEIHGPVKAFPSTMVLRFYNSTNGAILSSVPLSGQSITNPNGLFVIGDPGVVGGAFTPAGWTAVADNVPNANPSAMQLIDTATGAVYDSVVYEAMGGLGDLTRSSTNAVTGEGRGWMGEIGSGTDSSSLGYTKGRYPDGADTNVNENDFSIMKASPLAPNGGAATQGQSFDFTAVPAAAFQTYQLPRVAAPPVANNGNALRTVDLSGGGTMGAIGDAALGANGAGYSVSGKLYIPAASDPAQAVAIGICGRQGSNFFSSTTVSGAGYEKGYYLVYEHGAGSDLSDGLPAHPGAFQFLHAHRNNQSGAAASALGASRNLAEISATAGTWVPFTLSVRPSTNTLFAKINNAIVYDGPIPTGGPTSGAFITGYREYNGGTMTAAMGTWIDDLSFDAPVPVTVSGFELQ